MIIRRLSPPDAAAYRALMLRAYGDHPDAFTASVAEREAHPLSWWQARVARDGADQNEGKADEVVFGAFEGDTRAGTVAETLVGAAGFRRETREKTRHKSTLFGMYVAPGARESGTGDQLVRAVLAHARECAGLRVVQLTVSEGNARARRLYERCGFMPFGVEPMAVREGDGFIAKVHLWYDLNTLHTSFASGN
jgi:RimJ/RimL family protein N-acetyltransferase